MGGRGSCRAGQPHNTLKFPRHSGSFRGPRFPPRRTTTQHAQFSALFRVIPRPSFPAEANNHTTRSNFRVIPRHSAAIVSRKGEQPHKPNSVRRLGRSLALPGLPARRQPRPPRWNQRAPVRCPLSRQHPLAFANGSPSECLCNWCLAWSECFFTPRTSFYVEPESAGPE